MSRRGRYNAGGGKKYGTPTVNPPTPQGIDDYSGFKVPLSKLRKDWAGLMSVSPDRRNPQDYLRGVKDDQSLPYVKPEAPNTYLATNVLWEDGSFMMTEDGQPILTEGEVVRL